jgi:hypothetical protein
MRDDEAEALIEELFLANYQRLLAEGGAHVLTPRALEQARQQVEHYWKKMREVALSVTDTEVHLQLPNQRTPKGRRFVIEGVVDLVREGERVRMYDIKTHHCQEVQRNVESYAAQLNVYAYIWQNLRGQVLHEMGIIAVQLPEGLRAALRVGDAAASRREATRWNPLVPIAVKPESLEKIFKKIAETVDRIEEGCFEPPSPARLRQRVGRDAGREVTFATLHCRNCDGRFSCEPYRAHVQQAGGRQRFELGRYLDEVRDDGELEAWIDGNIELDLERLFPEEDE